MAIGKLPNTVISTKQNHKEGGRERGGRGGAHFFISSGMASAPLATTARLSLDMDREDDDLRFKALSALMATLRKDDRRTASDR